MVWVHVLLRKVTTAAAETASLEGCKGWFVGTFHHTHLSCDYL